MQGGTLGAEIVANWSIFDRWRLSAAHTWLKLNLHRDPDSKDSAVEIAEGESPQHQFQLGPFLGLLHNLDFGTPVYDVDRLPGQQAPSSTRLDTRLAWRLTESTELSAQGQNLFDPHHLEFHGSRDGVLATQAKRTVFGRITWRF